VDVLLGLVIRVSVAYVYLLVVLRLSGKRTIGEGTTFDFVVALILGDFPDDMIWGEVPVAQALVAIGTIVLLHTIVVYASYRSIAFDQLIGSRPCPVFADGRIDRRALAREHVNDADLESLLRHDGIEDWGDVEVAWIEPTGELSVRKREEAKAAEKRDRPALARLFG
jgi:uncharacterized membrane protein YcaP (DUF421 family)